MSEEAVMQWLSGLQGEVEYKTIDGEDCVTSIMLSAEGPGGFADPQVKSAFMWVEYSLLAHIDKFPHLQSLGFVGSCDGKWLAPLRGHKELQSLTLSFTQNLDSAGIQTLATLPKLNNLGMTGATLDDSVLREVSRLPKLETLIFGGPFSDGGVAYLRDNSRLKVLALYNLGRGKITNETLRHVGSLPNLEQFAFVSMGGDLPLTDDGLKYLAKSTRLQELMIQGDRITDAGLVHLYGLKNLKEIQVDETSVTQQGVDELKKHLPKVKVTLRTERSAKSQAAYSAPVGIQR
jgi:hypothetical protein